MKWIKFLEKNGVDFKKVYKNNKLNYEESDKIFPLLQQYSKDHKLIVEGVQLLDNTMSLDTAKVLLNEPIISVQTSARVSSNRASNRDNSSIKIADALKAKKLQNIFDDQTALSIGQAYTDYLLKK